MYCPNCGTKVINDEEICTQCGHSLRITIVERANPLPDAPGMLIASIHLENDDKNHEPWILWIGPEKSALISIPHNQNMSSEYGDVPRAGDAAHVYHSYAQALQAYPLQQILRAHPGSVHFDTAQIRLEMYVTFQSDFDRIDDYERFILYTPAGEFRGGFERGTYLDYVKKMLDKILGERFMIRTMQKFPDA